MVQVVVEEVIIVEPGGTGNTPPVSPPQGKMVVEYQYPSPGYAGGGGGGGAEERWYWWKWFYTSFRW